MPSLPSPNFFHPYIQMRFAEATFASRTQNESPRETTTFKEPRHRAETAGDLRGRPVRPWISPRGPFLPAQLQNNSSPYTAPSPARGSELSPGSRTVPRRLTPRLGTPLQTATGTNFDTARILHGPSYQSRFGHGPQRFRPAPDPGPAPAPETPNARVAPQHLPRRAASRPARPRRPSPRAVHAGTRARPPPHSAPCGPEVPAPGPRERPEQSWPQGLRRHAWRVHSLSQSLLTGKIETQRR